MVHKSLFLLLEKRTRNEEHFQPFTLIQPKSLQSLFLQNKTTAERLATNNTLIWLLQARKKTLQFLDALGVKANVTNK